MLLKKIHNNTIRNLTEWFLLLCGALILFLLLRTFGVRNVTVTGNSMEPTYRHGDRLIVSRFSYWFSEPQYGDIIVFPYKGADSQYFIKRVAGLPGDVIGFENNRFTVNGQVPDDDFSAISIIDPGDLIDPYTVPENCYFVLGDNRNGSLDSRFSDVGVISRKDIVGKALFRFWPLSRKDG